MLNHSIHAIEDLVKTVVNIDPNRFPIAHSVYDATTGLLNDAIKFELPESGIVIDRDKSLNTLGPADMRLPFPIIALEYVMGSNIFLTPDMFPARKRIALCIDYEKNKNNQICQLAARHYPQFDEVGGIIVVPCYYSENNSRWQTTWDACVIPNEPLSGHSKFVISDPTRTILSNLYLLPFPLLQELTWIPHNPMTNIYDEVMATVTLIMALSCDNVTLEDHPAPAPLNKKRVRTGKQSFHGYKTLIAITPGRHTTRDNSTTTITGRTVRTHIRRGHIRRLPDSRRIWIEQCIVNKGKENPIKRVYRVTPVKMAA